MPDVKCLLAFSNKYRALVHCGTLPVLSNKSLVWDSSEASALDCWMSKWISIKKVTGGNHPVLTPCEVGIQRVSFSDWQSQSDLDEVSCHFNSFSELPHVCALYCLLRSCMFDFGGQKSSTAGINTTTDGLTALQKLAQKVMLYHLKHGANNLQPPSMGTWMLLTLVCRDFKVETNSVGVDSWEVNATYIQSLHTGLKSVQLGHI